MWVKFENCLKMEVWEIWEGFGRDLGRREFFEDLGGIWAEIG
jgi:hypothetical protein